MRTAMPYDELLSTQNNLHASSLLHLTFFSVLEETTKRLFWGVGVGEEN